MKFFFGMNYIVIFEHLKRCVLVASTENECPWKLLSLVLIPSTSLVRNVIMSWSYLSIARMRGKISNQVFQRRLCRIHALTSIQQEIYMSKRLRDANPFYVET